MKEDKQKIILLSDSHLLKEKNNTLYGCNTYLTFKKVVDHVYSEHKHVDAVIFMGDISQDGSAESYHYAQDILNKLNAPVYFIPGNHDNKDSLYTAFNNNKVKKDKIIEINNWVFILLDTTIPPHDYGHLSEFELSFLRQSLEKHKQRNIIILMHHHPLPINTPLIDEFILKNKDDLLNVISRHERIKMIAFGHVHQVVHGILQSTPFMSCPSTCFQFPFGIKNLMLDLSCVGYRWLILEMDQFITGVVNLNVEEQSDAN